MEDPTFILLAVNLYGNDIDFNKYLEIEINLKEFDSFSDFLNLISQKIDLKINTNKYNVKINYEGSWVNLIDIKSLYFFISANFIQDERTKLLITKRESSLGNDNQIDFNLKGEKFENDRACDSNRPNLKIYDSINNINSKILLIH